MGNFKFKIIDNCMQDASQYNDVDCDFLIEEDRWNNYSYYTTYHLHATKKITGSDNLYLGAIEIMRKGQQTGQMYLLRVVCGNKVFEELPPDFVSVTFERKFYMWVQRYEVADREKLVNQLHIILDKESPFFSPVEHDYCFNKGVLRDTNMDNYIFQRARGWIYNEECKYDLRKESFAMQYDNCNTPVDFKFTCVPSIDSPIVPNGMVAFIGANGSGKSTALYKLAKVMFFSPHDRRKLEDKCGKIVPSNLGVERMILVSYSPFDNFTIPAIENYAHKYVDEEPSEEDGHFIYCGIRDVHEEYKAAPNKHILYDIVRLGEIRQYTTKPKTQELLAADFACAIKMMESADDSERRLSLWNSICEDAIENHPELHDIMNQIIMMRSIEDRADFFKNLSTGYKFFLHSIAYVVSFIKDGSLVLFDEPENHIHPPLLSFMMSQYRKVLNQFKSVMFISTHSPVIIQELFAENVYKVYREDDKMVIKKPSIETYGATFGEINSEVFNLTTDVTKYFNAFDLLYEMWGDFNQYIIQRSFLKVSLNA